MPVLETTEDLLPFRDPDYRADPYPYYDRIRAAGDVYKHPMGVWVVTRHDLITPLLRDRSMSVRQIDFGPATPLHDSMLGQDPPDHTRLRRATNAWLNPEAVERWSEFVRERAEVLLSAAEARPSFDAMHDLAYPLTHATMCHILGVPFDGSTDVREKTFDFGLSLGPGASDDDLVATAAAATWFDGYIRDLIAGKRENPGDGMLDHLLAAQDAGDFTEAEVIATTFLFFAVGHLDVSYLIVNGLRLMAQDPSILRAYRDEPDLRPQIINEILRFDTPEQFVSRQTTEPIMVGDVEIPAGELVMLMIGAANKDAAVFPDPHHFDIRRSTAGKGHLAFGGGMHGCAGQILARAEAHIVFSMVAERYPDLRLAGEPEWGHTEFIRALHRLPLAVG
jgi:cytochrome P450